MHQLKGYKRLALTEDGRLTWCTAPQEKIGWGRCNHVAHAHIGESGESFGIRAESMLDALEQRDSLPSFEPTYVNGYFASPSGMQSKWYDQKSDTWFKIDREGSYDGLAECLVSEFLDHSSVPHARYTMCWLQSEVKSLPKTGCASKSFLQDDEELITWSSLVSDPGNPHAGRKTMKEQFDGLLDDVCTPFGLSKSQKRQVRSYFLKTLAVDYITLNTDRHLGNLAFVLKVDQDGTKHVKPAPLFDHGGALGVNWNQHMFHHGMTVEEVEDRSPLATFTSDEPEDYLDLIHECLQEDASLDDMLVLHDVDALFEHLEHYEAQQYGSDIPNRSASLLLKRLKNSEGYAWIRE